jgi:hypothetical protein
MKSIMIMMCCTLSFSVFADIQPPPPNYTIVSNNTVDSNGEINDDPEQTVAITSTEKSTVDNAVTQADANIKLRWKKRKSGADARALVNPKLIK